MKTRLRLVFVTLVLSFLALASTSLAYDMCFDEDQCDHLGETYSCDLAIYLCIETGLGDFGDPGQDDTHETSFDPLDNSTNATIIGSNVTGNETLVGSGDILPEDVELRLSLLESSVFLLQEDFAALQLVDSGHEADLAAVQSDIAQLGNDLLLLDGSLSQVRSDVSSLENSLGGSLDSALAGLAAVESDLGDAQAELAAVEEELELKEKRAALAQNVLLVIISLLVFVALTYFITSHNKLHSDRHIPDHVRQYITKHIRKGDSYDQIRKKLVASGWPEAQVRKAYELTSQKNYFDYLKSQGKVASHKEFHPTVPPNNKKIVVISLLSVALLAAFVFFVSTSTGNAIATGQDLAVSVEDALVNQLALSPFYSLVDFGEVCVQVNDGDYAVSYGVIKTPIGHSVHDVLGGQCDWLVGGEYDFALKFSSYDRFANLVADTSCSNILFQHAIYPPDSGIRGVTVLPSALVAPGFEAVTGVDYSSYCPALLECLGATELQTVGISC